MDHVLGALEMDSYADAVIGTRGDGQSSETQSTKLLATRSTFKSVLTIKGLNFEQRKRLSIAVELAAKPALLLFLGETYPKSFEKASLTFSYR